MCIGMRLCLSEHWWDLARVDWWVQDRGGCSCAFGYHRDCIRKRQIDRKTL